MNFRLNKRFQKRLEAAPLAPSTWTHDRFRRRCGGISKSLLALTGVMALSHCGSLNSHNTNTTDPAVGAVQTSQPAAPRLNAQAGSGASNGASMTIDTQRKIGGSGVVELRRASHNGDTAEFTYAAILPGRGMNTFQLQAYMPGRGIVDVLHSISLDSAQELLSGDDPHGNLSFKYGGAILVPFANRIRGKLQPDGTHLTTTLAGHDQTMVANWKGAKPGAEKHAMHGLILNQPVEVANSTTNPGDSEVDGVLAANDFSGHWPAKMRVHFHISLQPNAFLLEVETKNTGDQPTPVGIGWHPYFAIPSGQRAQARLVIPARERALVNNYDDVFPTGKIEKVHGTKYDFTNLKGTALGDLFLDDCFLDLNRDHNLPRVAEIIDPAANYGLRIHSLSPQIKAFQVYAPVDQNFVAFEPQFNLGDPYSSVWNAGHGFNHKTNHVDTGMVTLKPGESVVYKVKLELFTPGK